jgi:hypothetical protein
MHRLRNDGSPVGGVVPTAVIAKAAVIVTHNIRDFSPEPEVLSRQHPCRPDGRFGSGLSLPCLSGSFYPRSPPGLSPVSFRSFQTSRLRLPAPLRSTGITRVQRNYEGSDSRVWVRLPVYATLHQHPPRSAARVSSLHVPHLPGSPSPITPPLPPIALAPVLLASGASSRSRVRASPFHPLPSRGQARLARRHGRNEFVILPIARSPRVAPHLTVTQLRSATGRKQGSLKGTCTSLM